MSYRRPENDGGPRSALLNLIPDYSIEAGCDRTHPYYQYSKEEDDFIVHPRWKDMIQKYLARVPRRIQRYAMIWLVLAVLLFFIWRNHAGPKYSRWREEINDMNTIPSTAYGTQVRPWFKDQIHVQRLDKKHLPEGDKRLIFIGDVHGCIDELRALLEKVDFQQDRDHLVLTGDIVNKGPNSTDVVKLAQRMGASCVRGNHEDKLLLTVAEMRNTKVPLPGPNEPLGMKVDFIGEESFSQKDQARRKLAEEFTPVQIQWLKDCPVILKVGKLPGIGETVVAHAGLIPDIPLEQQDPFQVMNMRTVDLKTRVPSEQRNKGAVWEKLWNYRQKKLSVDERTTIIYGHDARRGLNIQEYSKGLDSSCVRGGELTALVIDARGTQKYVSVKCKGYVQ